MGNSVSYCETAPAAPAEEPAPAPAPVEPEEPAKEEPEIKLRTAPLDFRFTSVNQSRSCYTHYNEYYKCLKQKGEDDPDTKYHKRYFQSLCPNEWVESWEELRSEGRWFGKY